MSAIVIRLATAGDLPAIAHIARETWHTTYAGIIPIPVQDAFLARAYSPDTLALKLRSAAALVVAQVDGEVVGYAQFNHRRGNTGDAELSAIYVLPAYHERGLGKRLLAAGLQQLAPDLQRLWVRVERDNASGRAFYDRTGFRRVRAYEDNMDGHSTHMLELLLDVKPTRKGRG